MQATRIIAVRHGETEWNAAGRIQGQFDIGLNARGRWQALQVAQAIGAEEIAAIYSSDLARAADTGRAIAAATARPLVLDAGLRERDFGDFQGRTFADIEADLPEQARLWRTRDPHWAPPGGGEPLLALRERCLSALSRLARQHPGDQIVLVAHGGVLDCWYRAATGQDLRAARTWALGNATVNRLLWTPEALTLIGWGDDRHLEQEALDETRA